MNKQQLAAKIWESANKMRSKIEANEYKDYILGFIFYKFLSEKLTKFALKEGFTKEDIQNLSEGDTETAEYLKGNLGYFLSYKDLFSTWLKKGSDFEVADVRDALSAFNRNINTADRKLFVGIFETLETGLSKLGDTAAKQTKAISDLIHLIKDIPMDGRQDYDVLGFIYEYLISMFAANAGKKAGEFYTPHEVSYLMSEIVAHHLKDQPAIQIYDPTSGSGSLLINIGKCVAQHMDNKDNVKYYAQELKQNTYNLTRMNLIMRGILVDNIAVRNGDTLEDDWPYFDEEDPINTYDPLYVDAVVSNPPYSQKWEPKDKEADPRYAEYGLAPRSKADYAFLLHDLYHLKPYGIMNIVLPHGVLFRGGSEGEIRKNLIEKNKIDAVIGLPANIFFGTGIPTIIMVLRQKRDRSDILMVDASKGFVKEGKNNRLRASDIKRILDTVINRTDVPKYAALVTKEEIRANDYNLNIPRYVDSSESAEQWDIYATMFGGIPQEEIDNLENYWKVFPELKEALFGETQAAKTELKDKDIKNLVFKSPDTQRFKENFDKAFADYDNLLSEHLIGKMETIKPTQEKNQLSNEIFDRLKPFALIDPYQAFQFLDDQWQIISGDLEILQTEGFEATRKVDPNIVIRKKNGKDTEVQEGWKGRIMPFDLVQEILFKEDLKRITNKEDRLNEIAAEIEESFDNLSEEGKDSDWVNEAKTAFINSMVKRAAKEIKVELKAGTVYEEEEDESIILKVNQLIAEESNLKKGIKDEKDILEAETKAKIETLTDEEINQLLKGKWVDKLVNQLTEMPKTILDELVQKLTALTEKYELTLREVNQDLENTEKELADMMAELTGNDRDMEGLQEWKKLLKTL